VIRLLIAVGAATAVLTAIILAYAATTAANLDPGAATLLALGAVWLGQALVALHRTLTRRS
jgi:hypothetical protein